MKKISELINMPIISMNEGIEYGKVKDILIDASNGTVVALILETTEKNWFLGADFIPFNSIIGLGESVLVINSGKDILPIADKKEFAGFFETNIKVVGTKVLTKTGKFKGKVTEVYVDTTGKIQICEMEQLDGQTVNISAENIITFGKEVLFIYDPEDGGPKSPPPASKPKPEVIPPKQAQPAPEPVAAPIPEPVSAPIPEPPQAVAEPVKMPPEEIIIPEPKQSIPTPEPVVEINVAAAAPRQNTPPDDDNAKNVDNKRRELLIGKKSSKRIETDTGVLIIEKDGIVTEEVLQKATLTNKLKELYLNVLK